MVRRIVCFLLLSAVTMTAAPIRTQFLSEAERSMFQSLLRKDSVRPPLIECLMYAEGETDTAFVGGVVRQIQSSFRRMARDIRPGNGVKRNVKIVFDQLRDEFLLKPNKFSLTRGLVKEGFYSSVTASALFADACAWFGLPVSIHRTSIHVYFTFITGNDTVRVEPCRNNGFDYEASDDDVEEIIRNCNASNDTFFDGKEVLRIVDEYRRFIPADPTFIVAERYALDGEAFYRERDYKRSLLCVEKANILAPGIPSMQDLYAMMFYMLSDDETKNKEHYYSLFERFLLNLGRNPEIIGNNLDRITRYAQYLRDNREYQRCQMMLENIQHLNDTTSVQMKIEELLSKHFYYWSYNLYEIGEYEAAAEMMGRVARKDTSNQRYIEASLRYSLRYATFLIERGKSPQATDLLDSLLDRFSYYSFVREAYLKGTSNIVTSNNLLRDDPEQAVRILRRSFALAPENRSTMNQLAYAYHNCAVRKMNTKEYPAARKFVDEGLKVNPADTYLKKDREYLDRQQKTK